MKKELNKIIIAIGFAIVLIGMIIDLFMVKDIEDAIVALASNTTVLTAVLAYAFIGAKNNVLKVVGYGLAFINSPIALASILAGKLTIVGIGSIVMAVGATIFYIAQVLNFFGFVNGKRDCGSDVVSDLAAIKALKDEKIITDEEFDSMKKNIFNNSNSEISSIDDLKKYKKLLDQKIITEEEYTQLKKSII